MDKVKKLYNSIDFNNLTYHVKGQTKDINFEDFSDVATLFDESKRIKLADIEKNQMDFKSKLSNNIKGGKELKK